MAASKPEIPITQLIYKIHAKFQRVPPCFQGPGIQRSYSLYCRMISGVKNPRWRLTNRNTYISACTQRNCTIVTATYIYVFLLQESNKAIIYIAWCKWKSEIQNGRSQKPWVYSFFSLHTTYQPNSNNYTHVLIPRIWMTLFSILRNASKKSKYKMVAYKPEILAFQPVYNVAVQFQPQYPCFPGRRTQLSYFYIVWCKLSQKSKMAACILPSACITHDKK